jgi:phosphoserine phosphatase
MSFCLVLISSTKEIPLSQAPLEKVGQVLQDIGIRFSPEWRWLAPGKAAELSLMESPGKGAMEKLWEVLAPFKIDALVSPTENRRKSLLIADMDATIVQGETLDDLAAFAGLKDRISAITARAMAGELDFKEALKERVSLLQGLSQSALQETLAAMKLSPGAETLVRVMRKQGSPCILVSGGFTFFTDAIANRVGFSANHGNVLEIENGKLTGRVVPPILDKDAKREFLLSYCARMNESPTCALAVGDGANDLPMLQTAGLGVGYRPKPLLRETLANCLFYADLTALLYLQGYTWQEIEHALH